MSYIFLTKQLKLCLNLLYNIYLVLHVILQSCLVKLLEAAKATHGTFETRLCIVSSILFLLF
jgi:hypothetical protein